MAARAGPMINVISQRNASQQGPFVLMIAEALDKVRQGASDDEQIAYLANQIVRKSLDKRAIRYREYRKWRHKNPLIFTSVVDEGRNLVGFFDIFPLTPEAGTSIARGLLTERSLTIDHILPGTKVGSATHVHLATILVNPSQQSFPKLVANELLLLKMGEFIKDHYSPLKSRTYTAYGQSKAGEALLRRSGFSVAVLAGENAQHRPLYILRSGDIKNAALRFDRVSYALSAMRRDPPELKELDARIESIELALRSLIAESLGSDPAMLPSHVNQKAEERLRAMASKNVAIDVTQYRILPNKLEFCDLRELSDTITNKQLWPVFKDRFVNKETLLGKFDQIADLRNGIRHSRSVDEIIRKEGEAGILWFERVLLPNSITKH